MTLFYSKKQSCYVFTGDREKAIRAGFQWSREGGAWITKSPFIAMKVDLSNEVFNHYKYWKDTSSPRHGNGILYPFQNAGVTALRERFKQRNSVALFDEQGLGKTIQAIKLIDHGTIIIVCPAALRLNWEYELKKWLPDIREINVMMTGKDEFLLDAINIVSYNLFERPSFNPDFMICDESHYLKNSSASRTREVLTVAKNTKTLFLSGTPLPNGRPVELFPILKNCAPDVIDGMREVRFLNRFHNIEIDRHGYRKFVSARNHEEFTNRLTASGFMIRRLKKDVLKDLPDKIHKLVVLEADSKIKSILEKEKRFDIKEIEERGPTKLSGLPELRREMAIATLPVCAAYIKTLLESSPEEKFVVFGHHIELLTGLADDLKAYSPSLIIGATSMKRRENYVREFQSELSKSRLFIGNLQAAGVGITLTASHNVILVEPDWVPGVNNQAIDRCHRIGQSRGVVVHYLAVKGSLTFKILKRVLEKSEDIQKIIGE